MKRFRALMIVSACALTGVALPVLAGGFGDAFGAGSAGVAYLSTLFLSLTGGTMTGQQVFDGAAGDILCDVASGSGEPLTFCPAAGQYHAVTATAVASTAEPLASWGVSDVAGLCTLTNATTGDGRFIPTWSCYNNQSASDFWLFQSLINATYDSGTVPGMTFRSARATGNVTGSASLVTRPTFSWQNYTTTQMDMTAGGTLRPLLYGAQANCSSSASPAVCAAAPAGSVTIAAAGTTKTVNTTAVTANSQIFVMEDSSLGTKLGVTCNTTLGRNYAVTARTAATSFVVTTDAAPVTNPACLSYWIIN